MPGKNLYFVSDFHLGTDDFNESSQEREKKIIRWLNHIQDDCKSLFILGDCFDYWFEFKEVVPKGHVRFLGKIAAFVDAGIDVHLFHGNHDMWLKAYLSQEIGVVIHSDKFILQSNEKRFFLSHGDGLGPGDRKYKVLKSILRNPINKWLFARLHPNLSIRLMRAISQKNGKLGVKKSVYTNLKKEWLYQFCENFLQEDDSIDYFIFGHRHLVFDVTLSNKKSRYINLGDMISFNSYAVFNGQTLSIKSFENENLEIITS